MQTRLLAAIYLIVRANKKLPLLPSTISSVTGIPDIVVINIFKEFEASGIIQKIYLSFNVYQITAKGFTLAETAYYQTPEKV